MEHPNYVYLTEPEQQFDIYCNEYHVFDPSSNPDSAFIEPLPPCSADSAIFNDVAASLQLSDLFDEPTQQWANSSELHMASPLPGPLDRLNGSPASSHSAISTPVSIEPIQTIRKRVSRPMLVPAEYNTDLDWCRSGEMCLPSLTFPPATTAKEKHLVHSTIVWMPTSSIMI